MKALLFVLVSTFAFATTAMAGGTGLTKQEVAKIKRYYVANGTGDGDSNAINPDQLKGQAETDYARLERGKQCKSFGYCPEAYSIKAYGTETLAVGVEDDGGTYITVYTADGKHKILSCSASESEDMTCSE